MSRPRYAIDPEFANLNFTLPLNRLVIPLLQAATRLDAQRQPDDARVDRRLYRVPENGTLGVEVVSPRGVEGPLPGLIFLHGGAFVFPGGGHHHRLAADYAVGAGCRVVAVDYRLAPQHPWPAAPDDALAATLWVFARAAELNIDPKRIGIIGDSAGGALAATVAQALRGRPEGSLRFQVLIYPVTDQRQSTASMARFTDTPLWNARLTAKMWALYLGRTPRTSTAEASPAQASSLAGLPPTLVELAEFDCLHDEGEAYARALEGAGVPVELTTTRGAPHGFEVNYNAAITQTRIAARIEFMKTRFAAT